MTTQTTLTGNWTLDSKQDTAAIIHRGAMGAVCVTVTGGTRIEIQSHTDEILHVGNVYPGTSAVFPVHKNEMLVVATVPVGKSAKGQFDFIPK